MNQETQRQKLLTKKNKNFIFLIILICCLIIFLYLLTSLAFISKGHSLTNLALAGDASAILNTLFSGGALIGVVVSIFLQRQDLKIQRDEMGLQREEMKSTNENLGKQKAEMEKQNKVAELERFESTFFNMLSILVRLVDGLEYTNSEEQSFAGRSVFKALNEEIEPKRSDAINNIIYQTDIFDHYFKYLYRIIKVVDEFHFDDDKKENHKRKYFYTSIVRAQLTSDEQFLIFYNGLNPNSSKLKGFIEKYSLLDGIRDDKIRAISQFDKYKDSAYDQSKYHLPTT